VSALAITQQEFAQFQRFIYEAAGIALSSAKKELVGGRLAKRLEPCQVDSYGAYFRLLKSGSAPAEVQRAIDLLTTNETYFFREEQHFSLLRELASTARGRAQPFRVWSAACSTGEEVYSIAMVLADRLQGGAWEVLGSDISTRVLARARVGHYVLERTTHIPTAYLKRFCLKGIGAEDGTLLVDRSLRSQVQFLHINLNEPLPQLGTFDVIFLRNVMIYFNAETKRQVVGRLLPHLKRGGYFIISRSESLNGVTDALRAAAPSIYRLSG
jgi:chemotaxis protein methyltransferase CheR